jgi:hypothetical protein
MDGWHEVVIDTRTQMAKWTALQDAFTKLYMASGGVPLAGMYARSKPGNATTTLYFSPAAFRLASLLIMASGATPCERPPHEGTAALLHNATGPSPWD